MTKERCSFNAEVFLLTKGLEGVGEQ